MVADRPRLSKKIDGDQGIAYLLNVEGAEEKPAKPRADSRHFCNALCFSISSTCVAQTVLASPDLFEGVLGRVCVRERGRCPVLDVSYLELCVCVYVE